MKRTDWRDRPEDSTAQLPDDDVSDGAPRDLRSREMEKRNPQHLEAAADVEELPHTD